MDHATEHAMMLPTDEPVAVQRRFKPYSAYKDSGIEWLGEVPAHWEVKPLKRLGLLQAGAGFPDDEQYVLGEELPFFKVGDMVESADGKFLDHAPSTVSRVTARRLRAFVFPANTIVFAKVGAALRLNRRRILLQPSCIDNNMMGFGLANCDVNWAFYWLSGLDLGELANPGAVPSVNEGQVREIPVVVPPEREQHAIGTFLDRETAKIDALVAKKEQLIELLQEKRAALITRAVTKGLPAAAAAQAGLPSTGSGQVTPNVPMKDSGVEWLGEIPAHWEVKRLKWITETMVAGPFGSSLTKDLYTRDGYRVYGQEQVIPGDFSIGDYYIPQELYRLMIRYAVRPGDVLISCVGTFGKIAVVPEGIEAGIINPGSSKQHRKKVSSAQST